MTPIQQARCLKCNKSYRDCACQTGFGHDMGAPNTKHPSQLDRMEANIRDNAATLMLNQKRIENKLDLLLGLEHDT